MTQVDAEREVGGVKDKIALFTSGGPGLKQGVQFFVLFSSILIGSFVSLEQQRPLILPRCGQFPLFLSLPESQGSSSALFDPLTFQRGATFCKQSGFDYLNWDPLLLMAKLFCSVCFGYKERTFVFPSFPLVVYFWIT